MVSTNGEGPPPRQKITFEFARGPEEYRLTCTHCGRPFSMNGEDMPKDWKKSNFVLVDCTNCGKQNRFHVGDVPPPAAYKI